MNYRLAEIEGLPEKKTRYQNLQKIRNYVGSEYKTPAALVRRGERHLLAVAANDPEKALPIEFDVPVLQGLAAHLRIHPTVETLELSALKDDDESIAKNFLAFEMRGHLFRHQQSDLWEGASGFIHYMKEPVEIPAKNGRVPPVALYPGFNYRLINVPGQGLCLAVDISHVYTDTRTLGERIARGQEWRGLASRHFVYEFGQQWFFIQLQEVTDRPISESRFEYPKGTSKTRDVYEHTMQTWKGRLTPRLKGLSSQDNTIFYNYPGATGQFQGAVNLARLRYQTDDPEIGRVHRFTILDPEDRMNRIQDIIARFLDDKIQIGETRIRISQDPLTVPAKVFRIPAQLFGNDKILPTPGQNAKPADITGMRRQRDEWLRDKAIGPLTLAGIQNQFLLMPMSLAGDEAFVERLQNDFTETTNEISPVEYRPQLVVWEDRDVRTVPEFIRAMAKPKQLMEQYGTACALIVLPEGHSRKEIGKLRRHIKRALAPKVRTKCIQAEEFLSYLDSEYKVVDEDYWSYLHYTALDLLITSGYWLWGLAEPLEYDLYVGIDVLNNTAGFTFVGANGTLCRFFPSTSEQDEKLGTDQVRQILAENLREFIPRIRAATNALPRHIIIHRDGIFHDSEQEGLNLAIAELKNEGLLPANVQVGVVEIDKTNAEGLRLVSQYSGHFQNPLVGSYHIFDSQWGLICTTGHPGLGQGTAEPLVVKVVRGNLDIGKCLKDIYWLSVLCWTKPDGHQRDPITIKLADDWLESLAAKISDKDVIFDSIESQRHPKNAPGLASRSLPLESERTK